MPQAKPAAKPAPAPSSLGGPARARLKHLTHRDAIEIILDDAIRDNEGTGLGCVGSPRYGKTFFLQRVHAAMLDRGVADIVFVHDAKAAVPQFDGVVVRDLADFQRYSATLAPNVSPSVVVFHHPNMFSRPSLQDVAQVAAAAAESRFRVCVCADEVVKGTNGSRDWEKPGNGRPALYPLIIREGGAQRISHTWGTQVPQQLPTECRVLTRSVACFHLEGLAADAACYHFRLGDEAPEVLRGLERGEFLLFCQGRDWDRTIYGPG